MQVANLPESAMDQGSAPLGVTYLATVPKIATDPRQGSVLRCLNLQALYVLQET